MSFSKYYKLNEIKSDPYLLINLIFCFFPISFIIGSFIVNLNIILFCCFGIYLLKSKILKTRLNLPIKIIFLFFFIIFFSSCLNFFESLYLNEYEEYDLEKIIKSFLFFRFFLFLIIIYLLNYYEILDFKYFFVVAAISPLLLSIDIIFQYFMGFDFLGFERVGLHNSGFFGDEKVAGGYLQRFSFFTILFFALIFENKAYMKLFLSTILICTIFTGIILSGNKMPLFLFILGLFFIFLVNIKMRKIIILNLLFIVILFKVITDSNQEMKGAYQSFFISADNIFKILPKNIQHWNRQEIENDENGNSALRNKTKFFTIKWESGHRRLFLTAVDTWKFNKIFGNGIKSFRKDCHKLAESGVNLEEDIYPERKNRLCSNHPHNYYFQILTSTGIIGLIIILIIGSLFINFLIKNTFLIKNYEVKNFLLLSAVVCLILETFPFRSTGGIFTTNNASYIALTAGIILSYKNILKIK